MLKAFLKESLWFLGGCLAGIICSSPLDVGGHMLQTIGVFLGVGLTDAIWTWYILSVENRKYLRAGALSGILMLIGGLVTIGYTQDHRLLGPAVLGAIVGTLVGGHIHDKITASSSSC